MSISGLEASLMDVAIGILASFRGGRWRILIARRRDDQKLGGLWELPGGKVEPGETPQTCVEREFKEELALVVKVGRALPPFEFPYPDQAVRLHPFYCTLEDHTAQAMDVEVAEHRWITADEINDYPFPPANEQLMRDIAILLGRHPSDGDQP